MKERDLKVPELGSMKLKHIASPEKSGIELQIKRTKFRSPLVDVFSCAKCLRSIHLMEPSK